MVVVGFEEEIAKEFRLYAPQYVLMDLSVGNPSFDAIKVFEDGTGIGF